MPAGLFLLALLLFGPALWADGNTNPEAPSYSAASITNSADFQPGNLAPNTIATIFGANLAYTTRALQSSDVTAGRLPSVLPNTGVRVLVGGIASGIYYVSPTQINFLVPNGLLPGPSIVQVLVDGLAGPPVTVQLVTGAPAIFEENPQTVIATALDGTLLTADNPANPGDYVVVYATGLGQALPPLLDREIPTAAAPIAALSSFQVTLAGTPLDPANILYAGVSPGSSGLYQINLKLPDSVPTNPEIRITIGDLSSMAGIVLPVAGNE